MSSIGSGALQSWQLLLTQAIKSGEEESVRDLLREGAAEHFSDRRDGAIQLSKALLQAVGSRYAEALTRILLEEGADANSTSETGVPALHRAAWLGKDKVAHLLLEHGANLESRNLKDGHTAIFEAVSKYQTRTFELLISAGANVNTRDLSGQNVLLYLASRKPDSNEKLVRLRDETTRAVLNVSTLDLEVTERDTSRTPLLCAAATGNDGLIRALLSRSNGAIANLRAVNNRGKGALHLAIEGNRTSTVKLLLDLRADPQAKSDGNWTPLLMAAEKNRIEIASALLGRDVDVNAVTSSGMSALHWAARNGHLDMVELLLQQSGIRRFSKDSFDVTPMLAAADQGHLEIAQLLSPSNDGPRLSPLARGACEGFRAEIVDFGMEKRPMNRHEHSVYDLLYGWNHKDDKPLITTLTRNVPAKPKFRWIHLPSNNMSWVEALINKYFIENSARDVDGFKLLEKSFSQVHRGTTVHSHFMRPLCHRFEATGKDPQQPAKETEEIAPPVQPTIAVTKVDEKVTRDQNTPRKPKLKKGEKPSQESRPSPVPRSSNPKKVKGAENIKPHGSSPQVPKVKIRHGNIVLFMPYLHYETHEKRKIMSATIEQAMNRKKGHRQSLSCSYDQMLIHGYLQSTHNLQIRRTLDQYYYHAIDTADRDEDQVVWRYTGNKGMVQKLFMVDQLWLWILSDDLIITSFPQRWEQPKHDPLNMLNGIIEDTNSKTRPPVKSVYDLAMLIAGRCIGIFDRHSVYDSEYQFLDMFESSLGEVVDTETTLFRKFNDASTAAARLLQNREQRQKLQRTRSRSGQGSEHNSGFVDTLLDISDETSLLAETKDIKDELSMLTMVLENQDAILGDFERAILEEMKGKANQDQHNEVKKRKRELERIISTQLKDIQRMQNQGTSLYTSLTHLLDLKQKHANAIEARFARDQAVFAGRQGQVVTIFTIVTVIFLPMSFIASIFAIPLTNFANGQGTPIVKFSYVAKFIFGVGLAISIPLIAVAFAVDSISTTLTRYRRKLVRGNHRTVQEKTQMLQLGDPDQDEPILAVTSDEFAGIHLRNGPTNLDPEKLSVRHRTIKDWRRSSESKRISANGDLERGP